MRPDRTSVDVDGPHIAREICIISNILPKYKVFQQDVNAQRFCVSTVFLHYRCLKNSPIVNIRDARVVLYLPETRLPNWFMLRYFQKYLHSHTYITINQWNAIILYIYIYIEVTNFRLRKREWLAFSNQGIFTWYANRAHITCLLTMQMTRS